MSESAAQDTRLMAPTQLGKDPECSVEQKLREVGVSESSGGTPLTHHLHVLESSVTISQLFNFTEVS